jgi:serine/threonine protein kinase
VLPPTTALEGQLVLQYRVVRRLGGGGMGEVYLAEDTRLGRQVALKFLAPSAQHDQESRERLVREARAAS